MSPISKDYALIYPRINFKFEAKFDPPFHSVLKEARERAGIGLRKLARMVNCSHAYLIMIEGGERKPSPKLLSKLQKELDIEPFFLVSGEEEELSMQALQGANDLEYSMLSLSYLMGHLHSALQEGGFGPIPGPPTPKESKDDFIARFRLGTEGNYELLIRRNRKSFLSEPE